LADATSETHWPKRPPSMWQCRWLLPADIGKSNAEIKL
jgi:hypothetical protein